MASTKPSTTVPSPSSPSDTRQSISIGTRQSRLALIQTDIVHQALLTSAPQHRYEIHSMATIGDKNQVTPLHNFGAKALWTHELEDLLLRGKLDIIVHSLKDMPTQLPPTLRIGAILTREDPRDAMVMKPSLPQYKTLASLPAGSIVGTSSVRRSAQIARIHPHLRFADVRGNVETRLRKLDDADGEYACLILAAAGLKRLDLGHRITQLLSRREGGLLHAVGQGALGIEVREGDAGILRLLEPVRHERTTLACLAERSLLRALEGGCSVPIGVETSWEEAGKLRMIAIVVSLDGRQSVEGEMTEVVATETAAEEVGLRLAGKLIDDGAGKILKEITLNRDLVTA